MASQTGTVGDNGWHNGPVPVDYTCADSGSGVAVCPADHALDHRHSLPAPQPLSPSDLELVRNTATAMWCDMTRTEATTLTPHNLVAVAHLDHWKCNCVSCLERRDAAPS